MKEIIGTGVLVMLAVCVHAQFDRSIPIVIDNSGGPALSNYVAKVTIDTDALVSAGWLNSQCEDLRPAGSVMATTYFDYWIDGACPSSATTIYVEVPAVPANDGSFEIYLLHNDDANVWTSASDKYSTLPLYDDFGAGIDANEWVQGNALEMGGQAVMQNTNINDNGFRAPILSDNFSITTSFVDVVTTAQENTWIGFSDGNIGTPVAGDPRSYVLVGVGNGDDPQYSYWDGANKVFFGVARTVGVEHEVTLSKRGNIIEIVFDGIVIPSFASSVSASYLTVYATNTFNNVAIDDIMMSTYRPPGTSAFAKMSVLPITWSKFYGVPSEEGIVLKWETQTELNSDRFEVEWSDSGTDFQTIGSVESQGTRVTPRAYEYVDIHPKSGTNYYRLKHFDFDQTFTYSDIARVHLPDGAMLLRVFPLPFTDELNVMVSKGRTCDLRLMDMWGKIVWTGVMREGMLQLATDEMKSGFYMLQITCRETGEQWVRRIAKD